MFLVFGIVLSILIIGIEMLDVDALYAGLSNAETGSFDNPFIRTTAKNTSGGSTAFGPVQVTYKLAQGAAKNGYLSPESESFYENVMKPKYELMLKHGNNKSGADYNNQYDYGGTAEFDTTQYGQAYQQFAKEIMSGIAKESGGNERKFIEKWRGKSVSQDHEYFKKVEMGKKIFSGEIAAQRGANVL